MKTIYRLVTKLTELQRPTPAETWVSIDEHPDSINDGGLWPPRVTASETLWPDVPASYHDGGAGVAFADGHLELHRWEASVLKVGLLLSSRNNFSAPPGDPDINWLRYRTPRQPGVN